MSKKNITILIILILIIGYLMITNQDKSTVESDQLASIQKAENSETKDDNPLPPQENFSGIKGNKLTLVNNQVTIAANDLDQNSVNHYNTQLPSGKTIYYFVVKDKNGIFRAAANACQVCFDARLGFYQQDDFMVCKACGNKYPLEKIATEKGSCNPGPINPNLKVINNQIIINQSELEQIADLF